ncbi:MAG: glycosyltransferase [Microgenomates group bacterium]
MGQKFGINKKQVVPIGWLVRKQFYQHQPKNQLRKKLKLQPNLLTILICGGSEGTNAVLKILPAFLKVKKPVQVIIICGKNTVLHKIAKSLEQILALKLKTFGFVKNLAPLIQASDLVIGKAGPNLLFETIACKKPFFAITHIHGQEDGNLDLIRKKKLGWVEEDGSRATELLLKIIDHPEMLNKWEKYILKEKKYIQSTGEKILNLALRSQQRIVN